MENYEEWRKNPGGAATEWGGVELSPDDTTRHGKGRGVESSQDNSTPNGGGSRVMAG